MQETQKTRVQFLGWEDPLEEEMATHSSILAWKIPWTEEPGGLQTPGSQKSQTRLSTYVMSLFSSICFHCFYTPLVCAVHFFFSVIFIPVSLVDTYGNEDVYPRRNEKEREVRKKKTIILADIIF